MSKEAEKIIRNLLLRLKAKDKILVAYRTGSPPPETAFRAIEKTQEIEEQASKFLNPKQEVQDG